MLYLAYKLEWVQIALWISIAIFALFVLNTIVLRSPGLSRGFAWAGSFLLANIGFAHGIWRWLRGDRTGLYATAKSLRPPTKYKSKQAVARIALAYRHTNASGKYMGFDTNMIRFFLECAKDGVTFFENCATLGRQKIRLSQGEIHRTFAHVAISHEQVSDMCQQNWRGKRDTPNHCAAYLWSGKTGVNRCLRLRGGDSYSRYEQ